MTIRFRMIWQAFDYLDAPNWPEATSGFCVVDRQLSVFFLKMGDDDLPSFDAWANAGLAQLAKSITI